MYLVEKNDKQEDRHGHALASSKSASSQYSDLLKATK